MAHTPSDDFIHPMGEEHWPVNAERKNMWGKGVGNVQRTGMREQNGQEEKGRESEKIGRSEEE